MFMNFPLISQYLEKKPNLTSNNLKAMQDAQKALLHSESSEKLKKDLRHKTRTCKNVKLFYGDSVYYKQFNSRNTEMAR